MPRGLRKKTKQYALNRFQEEDPESYFKYKMKSSCSQDELELMQAIEVGSVSQVERLLNRGVDPNFVAPRSCRTPLMVAVDKWSSTAEKCYQKIIQQMLFMGSDPDSQDRDGRSALHLACMAGHLGSVQVLVNSAADVNLAEATLHDTPLMLACKHSHLDTPAIVDFLLDHGAELERYNLNQQTALHYLSASGGSNTDLMCLCLRYGLSPLQLDCFGHSPVYYALVYSSNPREDLRILLCGGGSLTTALSQYISHSQVFTDVFVDDVRNVLEDCHTLIPNCQLRAINNLVTRITRNSHSIDTLKDLIHDLLTRVPSLSQLAKMEVRKALHSLVFMNCPKLPLPATTKTYLQDAS